MGLVLARWAQVGLLLMYAAGAMAAQAGFRETWRMKLPPGASVAIYEFEDMECPGCAEAAPVVRATAAKYHVPLVRKDFTLLSHTWSLDAAIYARVLEDSVSATLAESYRKDLFAVQAHIASRDDLRGWTKAWFTNHGRRMPATADLSGRARTQVLDDRSFGDRMGVHETPTFFVVTAKGATEVEEAKDLDSVVKKALGR